MIHRLQREQGSTIVGEHNLPRLGYLNKPQPPLMHEGDGLSFRQGPASYEAESGTFQWCLADLDTVGLI